MKIENIQEILKKEMSRKEFFQHAGIFILGIIGITSFLTHFSKSFSYQPSQVSSAAQSKGYGVRTYGR
jgi:hypothetical protein